MLGKSTLTPQQIKDYLKRKKTHNMIYAICRVYEDDCVHLPITKKTLMGLINECDTELLAYVDADGDLIIG